MSLGLRVAAPDVLRTPIALTFACSKLRLARSIRGAYPRMVTGGRLLCMVLLVGCGRLGYEGTQSPPDAGPPSVMRSRISSRGGTYWLGAQLPWRVYSKDFGDVDFGAATTDARVELEPAFQEAQTGGVHVIRWAMWADPALGFPFTTDGTGAVTGLAPSVLIDLDAAIDLATSHGLYLALVIFMDKAPDPALIADPVQRDRIASALTPLVTRAVSRGDRVVSWSYWPSDAFTADEMALALAMQATIHAAGGSFDLQMPSSDQIQSGCMSGADYVGFRDIGVAGQCATCVSYDQLYTDFTPSCAVLLDIGFASPGGTGLWYLNNIYDRGYAGVYLWSLLPARTHDGATIDLSATAAFATSRSDIGPL